MNTFKAIIVFLLFLTTFAHAKVVPIQFNVDVIEENLPWNLFRQPSASFTDAALFILPMPILFSTIASFDKKKQAKLACYTLAAACATVNVIPLLLLKAGYSAGTSYTYGLTAGFLLAPILSIDYSKPILPQLQFDGQGTLTVGSLGAIIAAISMGIGAIALGIKNACQHHSRLLS